MQTRARCAAKKAFKTQRQLRRRSDTQYHEADSQPPPAEEDAEVVFTLQPPKKSQRQSPRRMNRNPPAPTDKSGRISVTSCDSRDSGICVTREPPKIPSPSQPLTVDTGTPPKMRRRGVKRSLSDDSILLEVPSKFGRRRPSEKRRSSLRSLDLISPELASPKPQLASPPLPWAAEQSTTNSAGELTPFKADNQLTSNSNSAPNYCDTKIIDSKTLVRECSENSSDSGIVSDDQSSTAVCQWRYCKADVSPADLVDHVNKVHVGAQISRGDKSGYRCYWDCCKVYGKVSKSLAWLEGHIKKHLGSRPHHCIFPDCKARFGSAASLQKHVNTHISAEVTKLPRVASKTTLKKNSKRLKGTEHVIARHSEYFAPHILEAVKWEQKRLHERWAHLLTPNMDALSVHGQVVALARAVGSAVSHVQLRWYPQELSISDSWHSVTDPIAIQRLKTVKLSSISRDLLLGITDTRSARPHNSRKYRPAALST